MAAAFELTRPAHGGKYSVTIYQLGWRLGGKGASGRGLANRIEEHGLHLWMGFYENAFRLMRECYAEAKRDPRKCRIADWRDAFSPDNFNAVADRSPNGKWLPWKVTLPPLPGLPGDPTQQVRPWTVADYLSRTVILIRTLLEAIQMRAGPQAQVAPSANAQPFATTPAAVVEGINRLLRIGQLASLGAVLEALRFMQLAVTALPQYSESLVLRFHDTISSAVRALLEELITRDDELRRLWEIVDLALATVRGIIRFRIVFDPRGFDAINEYDCRDWLALNGASKRSVNSAFIRALYDLAFAYEDGDVEKPRIAAGQAVRGAVRAFFTYRGAFFWKMQAGMGDVVFAPFWEVLKARGVRFKFFHRLENVRIDADASGTGGHVRALDFDVQADVLNGDEYRPLVDMAGLPCWPSQPDWQQLADGHRLRSEGHDFESHWDRRCIRRTTLHVGVDFFFVVLGMGIGAVPHACR
jgi:uncharacterized protein with NAD-binding domain and iron-sulfur cluster